MMKRKKNYERRYLSEETINFTKEILFSVEYNRGRSVENKSGDKAVNIQSISSQVPVVSLHNPKIPFLSSQNKNAIPSETLYSVDKIPVIPPQKLVELLSLVNSAPDIIRNHTDPILDIRA